ncbi:MAG: putative toxin-antitoxin system toxin component, PIN family [Chloroflexota bacterium]
MRRVVLDTVVFVRSLINPHSIWGRLVFAHYGEYALFVSQPVLQELLEVLQRPEITRKFRSIGGLDRRRLLEILSQAEVVDVSGIPAVSRDPKDDKFLATARAAVADYLVTEDQDLLVLQEFEGTQIVNTSTFLGILELP